MKLGLGLGFNKKISDQTPLSYFGARLVRWYDPSQEGAYTLVSDRVSQLDDLSGNDRHATQGTAGARPLLDGTDTINGLPCMYHDSTARYLQSAVTAGDLNALGQHVFAIAEWDTLNTFSAVYGRYAGAGSREYHITKQDSTSPANTVYTQYSQDGTALTSIGKVTGISINTPYITYVSVQDDEYVEVGVNKARADQRSLITGSVFDDPTPPNITIGAHSTGTVQMRGKIGEIIVVSGDLSVADKDFILRYLGNKWGIDVVLSSQDTTTATVGQSNILLWDTDDATYTDEGRIAYQTEILTQKETQFFFTGAVNGSAVLEAADTGSGHWVTDATGDGPALSGFITNAAAFSGGIAGDISRYKNILIVNGEADATAIAAATITKAQFKTALTYLVERLHAVCPDAKLIFTPLGRRTGGNDSATQQVRDAQLEVIAAKSYCYLGWENHDQPLQDTIHRTPAGYTVEGTRAAEFVLSGNLRGPVITSATYSGQTVTATVSLDSGSAISGSEVNTFRVEDDGTPVTISAIEISGNIITLDLDDPIAPGSTVQLWCNYGQGASVTAADVVKDANGYPIRTVSALSVTAA